MKKYQNPRSGRRPGDSGTREAIREAARRQFSELGYDRASLRSIAAEAGVDPGLVRYFHSSKQQLFVWVVDLPIDPAVLVPHVFSGSRAELGQRLATFVLGALEEESTRQRAIGLVRAAASEPEAAELVRRLVEREILTVVAEALDTPDAELRVNLVGSQIVGLVMARYVIGLEPLASTPPAEVAAAIAPTLQRYLTAPLDA